MYACTHKLTVHSLTIVNCTEGDVRLVDGPSANKGRLEVCINETWASVCSRSFGYRERGVACAQLGYQRYYGILHKYQLKIYKFKSGLLYKLQELLPICLVVDQDKSMDMTVED